MRNMSGHCFIKASLGAFMRITSSIFSAIDAVLGLIALVGFITDIVRNRRNSVTYLKLFLAVVAFVLFSGGIIIKTC